MVFRSECNNCLSTVDATLCRIWITWIHAWISCCSLPYVLEIYFVKRCPEYLRLMTVISPGKFRSLYRFFFLRNGSDIYPFLNISYRCSSFLYYYIYSKLINLYSLHVYLLISRNLNFLSFSKIWHNINYYCIWRIEIKKFRERKIKKFHEERVSKFINNRSSRKSVPMTRVDETISSRTRTRISRTWFSPPSAPMKTN